MSKEVAKSSTAVSTEVADLLEAHRGAGTEEMTTNDGGRPLIILLQSNTPLVNGGPDVAVKGAQAGMFYQMNTRELISADGFLFLPCHLRTRMYEAPFDAQGRPERPVFRHPANYLGGAKNEQVGKKNLLVLPNGNCIYEVKEWFGFRTDKDAPEPVEIRMKSSSIGGSNELVAEHRGHYPPKGGQEAALYSGIYRIKAKHESAEGNNWKRITASWEADVVSHPQAKELIMGAAAYHNHIKAESGLGEIDAEDENGEDAPY